MSELDNEELIATRRLNGLEDNLFKENKKMKLKDILDMEEYLKERIESVDKIYNEMLTDIGGIKIINVSGLNKKEKEEVINKRNCLLVQKQCYQEILEKIQE